MEALILSTMIGATATFFGAGCPEIFTAAAAVYKYPQASVAGTELPSTPESDILTRFAKAACATSNPDIFWKISYQESSLEFLIVRLNKEEHVLRGQEALDYLTALKAKIILEKLSGRQLPNIDIGTMQVNLRYHGDYFGNDPLKMLDPVEQVSYLSSGFGEELYKRCRGQWLGCYHNAAPERSATYIDLLTTASDKLKRGLRLMIESRAASGGHLVKDSIAAGVTELGLSESAKQTVKRTLADITRDGSRKHGIINAAVPRVSMVSDDMSDINHELVGEALFSFYPEGVVWPEQVEKDRAERIRKSRQGIEITADGEMIPITSLTELLAES